MPNLKKECPYCEVEECLVCIDTRANYMQPRLTAEVKRIYYCTSCGQTMLHHTPESTVSKINYSAIPSKYKTKS